jgi:hypothetical protein
MVRALLSPPGLFGIANAQLVLGQTYLLVVIDNALMKQSGNASGFQKMTKTSMRRYSAHAIRISTIG